MNWKVLLAGAGVILIVFLSYLGIQFIQNRRQLASDQAGSKLTSVTVYPNGEVPANVREIAQSEVYAQTALIRGEVTKYDRVNHVATVAVETRQLNGTYGVIGLLDISIDPKLVKDFLCWPSVFKTQTGQDISIRYAYMPINQTSTLQIKDQVVRPINELEQYFATNPFVFALLTSSPTDAQAMLENTADLPTQVVKQLAILGCNE